MVQPAPQFTASPENSCDGTHNCLLPAYDFRVYEQELIYWYWLQTKDFGTMNSSTKFDRERS